MKPRILNFLYLLNIILFQRMTSGGEKDLQSGRVGRKATF